MVLRISEKRKIKIRNLLAHLLTSDPIIFEGLLLIRFNSVFL